MEDYAIEEKIGQGAFGKVYKYLDIKNSQFVAIKQIIAAEFEAVEHLSMRCASEIAMLKTLQHKNIVELKATFLHETMPGPMMCLVFELMDTDLAEIIFCNDIALMIEQVASGVKQILEALRFCHHNDVLHLDIRPSNILVNQCGIYKLSDFGLASYYTGKHVDYPMRYRVVTRWYRSLEILMGAKKYGPEVDIWSTGCVMAEMILRSPLFPAENSVEQIKLLLGDCPAYFGTDHPGTDMTKRLKQKLPLLPEAAFEILAAMLSPMPSLRISAGEALTGKWLRSVDPTQIIPPDLSKVKKEKRPISPSGLQFAPNLKVSPTADHLVLSVPKSLTGMKLMEGDS